MLRNCSLKISKFLLLICFFSLNNQLFAKEIKDCPEDFPPVGIKFIDVGEKQFKITITESKFLKDALNNESLAEHIALLKLDVVEQFQKIIGTEILSTPTKYGGSNSHMAIRCTELDVPGVIGCGEEVFEKLKNCDTVSIDCMTNKIIVD